MATDLSDEATQNNLTDSFIKGFVGSGIPYDDRRKAKVATKGVSGEDFSSTKTPSGVRGEDAGKTPDLPNKTKVNSLPETKISNGEQN